MGPLSKIESWHILAAVILLGFSIFLSGVKFGFDLSRLQMSSIAKLHPEQLILEEEVNGRQSGSSLMQILSDLKSSNLGINVLTSIESGRTKTPYAIYPINVDYTYHQPFGESAGSILSTQDLVLLDLNTGERTVFRTGEQLTHPDLISFIKDFPGDAVHEVRVKLLRTRDRNVWGEINVYAIADPPVSKRAGYFTIDLDSRVVKTFALPDKGFLASTVLNPNSGKVLYESVANGLELYEYNLYTATNTLLVSYSEADFGKYCSHYIAYIYKTSDFYGDCGMDHALEPNWLKGGVVSYYDFVTRERVEMSIP